VRERFDEIVEFAELWDAIERPVRTYSTGMVSRLQFALATTVSPDILLLDELLGAGDAAFTEKSRTRMFQMLRRARAVVVVTHDLQFVRENCSRAVLLEGGEVLYQGAPPTAVIMYQDLLQARPKRSERSA
jgi:ABC-type polysaccharide/polyol phosphate transport system ATPase subunit